MDRQLRQTVSRGVSDELWRSQRLSEVRCAVSWPRAAVVAAYEVEAIHCGALDFVEAARANAKKIVE